MVTVLLLHSTVKISITGSSLFGEAHYVQLLLSFSYEKIPPVVTNTEFLILGLSYAIQFYSELCSMGPNSL